jgi:hypothetical protein
MMIGGYMSNFSGNDKKSYVPFPASAELWQAGMFSIVPNVVTCFY